MEKSPDSGVVERRKLINTCMEQTRTPIPILDSDVLGN
jgi:hypothetical protein